MLLNVYRLLACSMATIIATGTLTFNSELVAADLGPGHDHAVVEALLRLPKSSLEKHPEQQAAVARYIKRVSGTSRSLMVIEQLGVRDQLLELDGILRKAPFSTDTTQATRILLQFGEKALVQKAIDDPKDETAVVAITAIGYANADEAIDFLTPIVKTKERSLSVRIASATALGRSVKGQRVLLKLAKDSSLSDDLQFAAADALLGSSNDEIKKEAAQYVKPAAAATNEPIPPTRELEKMRGDAAQGKIVFNTSGTCIKCHKVLGEGKEVGPDLSEIGSKLSREDMYVSILNPSAGVSHNYETYSLLTSDGLVLTGTLINQTDKSVTIRNAEAVEQTIAADDIESLKKQAISLMPADLQKNMSVHNLVDLVDYLVLLRKPDETQFNTVGGDAKNKKDRRSDKKVVTTPGRAPEEAIAGLEIADGIDLQLFSSEPQMFNPTNIDVDHLGRVWVCEAANYRQFRNPSNPVRSEGDRILVLEDTDHDGRADKSTVFYQGTDIDSPHGVCVLGSDVIVSAGANVFVFSDTDGDLKSDHKRLLFTGIDGVQHDHGIHSFTVGQDGKLYFNFGNEGKQIRTADGKTIIDLAGNAVDGSRNPYQQGMVFRCNIDGAQFETLGWNFRNNWELCLDSFGTIWQSDNDDDGNRGTRINYVMEYGNFGYRDEMTGATWQTDRIGIESDIPLRHWHLNDPGVVPNLLQTGAGSPTGILFYEGSLLPKSFQNQIIHCDPGPNVVRAYPIENDKAGYLATIKNLVQGVEDQWFRPVDVCAAPDGSIFIADWYDPGVGGHRMGDTTRGRIFRAVPTGHVSYQVPTLDLNTAEGAVTALQSPNVATQFLAQQALAKMGSAAENSLVQLAAEDQPLRMRARALWQLGRMSNRGSHYVEQAITDEASDLRIVGIRLARELGLDVIPIVRKLVKDSSPQVRRELAIALRHNRSPQTPALWAELARQHDGTDRWYLEALGIGADKQWNGCFDAWLARVGDQWNSPAGRDIVWRSRAPKACAYLAKIIRNTAEPSEQYRYFRALDFHDSAASKTALELLLSSE
ncbi:MAG: PVC-type heme-binding CxxCH protein [Pirellulaceae bacterium]|nr:PVC-type heme-binding CxxCH protein [Pirellulaceae bacterium]